MSSVFSNKYGFWINNRPNASCTHFYKTDLNFTCVNIAYFCRIIARLFTKICIFFNSIQYLGTLYILMLLIKYWFYAYHSRKFLLIYLYMPLKWAMRIFCYYVICIHCLGSSSLLQQIEPEKKTITITKPMRLSYQAIYSLCNNNNMRQYICNLSLSSM